MKTLIQNNKQLFSKNLAIIGEIGCGKTVLLQSLLESSQQQDTKVITVDWEWTDRASALGLWAEKSKNGYRHLARNLLGEIPSSASLVVFDIQDTQNQLIYNSLTEQVILALRYALSQSTNVSQTIFCINGVDPLLSFPKVVNLLEIVMRRKNIQVILVSQLPDNFSEMIRDELSVWLVGRISGFRQIESIRDSLLVPETELHKCTDFASPREQNCSSWLFASAGVPEQERFHFYQHYIEQVVV